MSSRGSAAGTQNQLLVGHCRTAGAVSISCCCAAGTGAPPAALTAGAWSGAEAVLLPTCRARCSSPTAPALHSLQQITVPPWDSCPPTAASRRVPLHTSTPHPYPSTTSTLLRPSPLPPLLMHTRPQGFVCSGWWGTGCGLIATNATLSYGDVASKTDVLAIPGYFDCGFGKAPAQEALVSMRAPQPNRPHEPVC